MDWKAELSDEVHGIDFGTLHVINLLQQNREGSSLCIYSTIMNCIRSVDTTNGSSKS